VRYGDGVKKIFLQLVALLWKLIRTYGLRWLREFLGRFARMGVVVMVVGLALCALLVLLLSAAC